MGLGLAQGAQGRRWWAGVFLAALAVRLAWLGCWQAWDLSARLGYDPYVSIAAYWHGWAPPMLDITHPPLYPLWVYLLFGLLGRVSFAAVQACNVVFSALSCLLLGLWAERASGDRTLGRLAGLWTAFDPLLVFFSAQLQSEAFFVFLQLLFFLALQGRGSSPARMFLTGILGGSVSLARSVFGLFAAPLCAALFWSGRLRRAAPALLLCAGWALAPALWGARNKLRHGAFIPLAVNGGWNLWEGFTLDREEVRRRPYEMAGEIRRAGLSADDAVAAADYFARKTRAFVRERPGAALKIVLGKFFLYWRPWPYDPHQLWARALVGAYFAALFALAALGAWSLRRLRAELAPVWALFLYLSALHSVFFTSLRYRSPLEPFLCFFAAAGLRRLLGGARP